MDLQEITSLVGGTLHGPKDRVINGVNDIKSAAEDELSFLGNPRYEPFLAETKAGAVLVGTDIDISNMKTAAIVCDNPSSAFAKVCDILVPAENTVETGINPGCTLGENCHIDPAACIGAGAVIGDNVTIGAGTVISPLAYIGRGVCIGADCLIKPNASIMAGCKLGDRVIVHPAAVIGCDGFGYERHKDGSNTKITQAGIVVLEDDVEIGSCVTIDRARFGETVIGAGTKVDNLVQIAHNCRIGKNCLIIAQVGLSGSTIIGDNVIMAGRSGSFGHINIGDGAVVTAVSVASKDIPAGTQVSGMPARPVNEHRRSEAVRLRLPEFAKRIKALEKKVKDLE